eukprot:TRINITY_DN10305_c0_g1_i2.p1 TRINITY_DN10305_c0_g1~~TRINITY_DN10305_c0_g1_i2.p1  ORF type:complete len:312 (-),score=71.30 TRINITY_DN10305_c0_g1_i2:133-1068(-)
MEFIALSRHTGDMRYAKTAQKIINKIEASDAPLGLYPTHFAQSSGALVRGRSTLGALGDSFYEYLLKVWLLTGKALPQYDEFFGRTAVGITRYMLQRSDTTNNVALAELQMHNSPNNIIRKQDHLACFAGGMFALGSWHGAALELEESEDFEEIGEDITETCFKTYQMTATGISPEITRFDKDVELSVDSGAKHYLLRPETVESLFVLYRVTQDRKYQEWGWEIFEAIEKHCKVKYGYSGIRDVSKLPVVHDDRMESFFLGETLKYLYLLFSEHDLIPLDKYVFNTEAHPLTIFDVREYPELMHVLTSPTG